MTNTEQSEAVERVKRYCCGNAEAMEFLCLYARYCSDVDDIVDDRAGLANIREWTQKTIAGFAMAAMVYSHPFYLRHLQELRGVALLVTNMYADSELWKESGTAWQRDFAETYRYAASEMVIAVARITGGFEHGRKVSQEQRKLCYETQHPEEGSARGEGRSVESLNGKEVNHE